jgi:hypothetical protein
MELVSDDVEAFHCGFADLDALLVATGVEGAFDLQAGLGGGRADTLHDLARSSVGPVVRMSPLTIFLARFIGLFKLSREVR